MTTDRSAGRQITGLTPRPREFDVSGLTARDRPAPTPEATEQNSPTVDGAAGPGAPAQAPEPAAKVAMSVYLSAETRDRARAAYRATGHLHDDQSWSAFVERAVLALTEAREREHNDGERYQPHRGRLAPGRPSA